MESSLIANAEEISKKFPKSYENNMQTLKEISKNRTQNQYWNKPGVYAFYDPESKKPIYVGRSRNICQRLKDHQQRNHNSGSLAFKLARDKYTQSNKSANELSRRKLQAFWDDEEEETEKHPFQVEIEFLQSCFVHIQEVQDSATRALTEVITSIHLDTVNGLNDWTES